MNSIKFTERDDEAIIDEPIIPQWGKDDDYINQEGRPMYGIKFTEKDDNIYLGEITGLPANGFDNND